MLAALRGLVHQITEARIEFGRASCEIHRVRLGEIEGADAGLGRGLIHGLAPSIRTGIHMAVATAHVAELTDIDLEDLNLTGRERGATGRPNGLGEVRWARRLTDLDGFEDFDLPLRRRQGKSTRPHGCHPLRRYLDTDEIRGEGRIRSSSGCFAHDVIGPMAFLET